jgi:TolB protein
MLDEPEQDSRRASRRLRWLAALLLIIFLCGAIGAPVAGLALWRIRREPASAAVATSPPDVAVVTPASQESGSAEATLPADGVNRIAFIDLEAQINTIAPNGSDLRELTSGDDFFQFPAWSPDSTRLAAVAAGADGGRLVVLADTATPAEPLELYRSADERPFYLYWSPDSQQISFLANHPDGIGLHLADAAGSTVSRLFTVGQPVYWNWAEQGRRMLLHVGLTGTDARLAYVESSGDGSGDNIAQPGYFQAPGISASGRFWSFAAVDEDGDRSVVVQDSQDTARVATPHEGLAAMGWSPAEDVLAYIAPEIRASAFFGPLRLLDAATGASRSLSREVVVAFFWSPDGRSLAYFTVPHAEEPGINASRGARLAAVQAAPPLSPAAWQQGDGVELDLWIADVASGESRRLLTFRPTRIFLTQFLPFFDQYALSHRLWSPDSQALALPSASSGSPEIVIVSAVSGEVTPIMDGVIAFWSQR